MLLKAKGASFQLTPFAFFVILGDSGESVRMRHDY